MTIAELYSIVEWDWRVSSVVMQIALLFFGGSIVFHSVVRAATAMSSFVSLCEVACD